MIKIDTGKQSPLRRIYGTVLIAITLIFLLLLTSNLFGLININKPVFKWTINSMLILFFIDYLWRFERAKVKSKFIYQNFYDLIAILPFGLIFSFVGITSAIGFGLTSKFTLIGRLIGTFGKLNRSSNRFLNTNSFYKIANVAVAIIMTDSLVVSIAEKVPFGDAVWWAIVTTTTVGYGDFYPHTMVGKLAAVVLMFLGIGLIGYLTSTITNYFTDDRSKSAMNQEKEQSDKIDDLEKKVDLLLQKIDDLKYKE